MVELINSTLSSSLVQSGCSWSYDGGEVLGQQNLWGGSRGCPCVAAVLRMRNCPTVNEVLIQKVIVMSIALWRGSPLRLYQLRKALASLGDWNSYDLFVLVSCVRYIRVLCIPWEVCLAISEDLFICLVLFHSTCCAFLFRDSGTACYI